MDLWQLKIFCKVVELKSFSKAGEVVRLSQPTVSSHIKDLEVHFGTQLLDRLPRNVFPTKAGELLYGYAQRLLSLNEDTENAMAEFSGKIKGRIIVGGSTIPGGYLLPRIIGLFSSKYPDVRISLIIGDTTEILDKTLAGNIEVSVVGALSKDKKNLRQIKVARDEMVLVIPADHKWAQKKRINLQQLLKEPFIIREAGSGTLKSIEGALTKNNLTANDFNIIAEMGSTEAIRQAIKNKLGISILSSIAVSEECRSGTLKAIGIEGLDLNRSFYLTTHTQRSLSPICRALIDTIIQGPEGAISKAPRVKP